MALVERKLEIIDWKTPGKNIGGYLISAKKVRFQDGGTAMRYLIQRRDGSIVAVPGASQLDMRIQMSDINAFVQIQYVGEDETRQMAEGRSKPKLFKVAVDSDDRLKVQQTPEDPTTITDDDIPF